MIKTQNQPTLSIQVEYPEYIFPTSYCGFKFASYSTTTKKKKLTMP